MGAGKGAYDFTSDTVKGLWNTIAHPIDTGTSLVNAVTHPIDTYNIFKDAIQTSYQRDMVDGDAESRTRWLTYAGGTIVTSVLGTKGADKVSKVGTTAAKTTVSQSKATLNNINQRTPNLFPLGPKYELVPVGPVPYNVIDSGNLKDQMIRFSKHFTDHTKTKLKPNVTYRAGEYNYLYKTDQFGRIKEFSTDNLQLTARDGRLRHNPHTLGKQPSHHAGHIAGDRFGGSPELDNLVSQLSNVNLSRYKVMENEWASALKQGKEVKVNVNIHYDGARARPSEFEIEYSIDGEIYDALIEN